MCTGSSGGLYKMPGISWLAEELLCSEKTLISVCSKHTSKFVQAVNLTCVP